MKTFFLCCLSILFSTAVAFAQAPPPPGQAPAVMPAPGQSKADACKSYADQAMANAPTTTGAGRGAARGAVVGAMAGNAGGGAAVGAATGATRRAVQRNRSRDYYYNYCMTH